MPSDISKKLEQAIRDEEEMTLSRLRAASESDRSAEDKFRPVRLAAEEIRERLQSAPSIEFTIQPASVWISLADRDLAVTYDIRSDKFIGEESGYNWYDSEPYAENYEWDTAEACIDAGKRGQAQRALTHLETGFGKIGCGRHQH